MKPTRPSATRRRWILFVLVALAVSAALAHLTNHALSLERRALEGRMFSGHVERVRLALGRMDAALTAILARESARLPSVYEPFVVQRQLWSRDWEFVGDGLLEPSPLLGRTPSEFRLYFTLRPDGRLGSPSAPQGDMARVATGRYLSPATLEETELLLGELAPRLDRDGLLELLASQPGLEALEATAPDPVQLPDVGQSLAQSAQEYRARNNLWVFANSAPTDRSSGVSQPAQRTGFIACLLTGWSLPRESSRPSPRQGEADFELLFVRRVDRGEEQPSIQGIWVDWDRTAHLLLRQINDLFPAARLRPATDGTPIHPKLAGIPFRLEPGSAVPPAPDSGWSATRLSLLALWATVLAAFVAVGLVLRATLELSERRRRFVSAVTHELRTPLTTFCMYSEMLAGGMVTDDDKRREYVETLHSEASRLRRIVENVLSFARVEESRAAPGHTRVPALDVWERVLPVLERRAEEGGMELVTDAPPAAAIRVEADPQAVEQILFNLVDNACKYAAESDDRRIDLTLLSSPETLAFVLTDHGPGVPPEEVRKVFRPFHRAAGDAEGTTPGIGLGLALARGMAEEMGGSLELTRNSHAGAAFTLHLRRVPS